MAMPHAADPRRVAVGQVRRLQVLESVSSYRVVELDGELVVAEVISAPGLEPGSRVRLTPEAVAAMELVAADSALRPGPIADAA